MPNSKQDGNSNQSDKDMNTSVSTNESKENSVASNESSALALPAAQRSPTYVTFSKSQISSYEAYGFTADLNKCFVMNQRPMLFLKDKSGEKALLIGVSKRPGSGVNDDLPICRSAMSSLFHASISNLVQTSNKVFDKLYQNSDKVKVANFVYIKSLRDFTDRNDYPGIPDDAQGSMEIRNLDLVLDTMRVIELDVTKDIIYVGGEPRIHTKKTLDDLEMKLRQSSGSSARDATGFRPIKKKRSTVHLTSHPYGRQEQIITSQPNSTEQLLRSMEHMTLQKSVQQPVANSADNITIELLSGFTEREMCFHELLAEKWGELDPNEMVPFYSGEASATLDEKLIHLMNNMKSHIQFMRSVLPSAADLFQDELSEFLVPIFSLVSDNGKLLYVRSSVLKVPSHSHTPPLQLFYIHAPKDVLDGIFEGVKKWILEPDSNHIYYNGVDCIIFKEGAYKGWLLQHLREQTESALNAALLNYFVPIKYMAEYSLHIEAQSQILRSKRAELPLPKTINNTVSGLFKPLKNQNNEASMNVQKQEQLEQFIIRLTNTETGRLLLVADLEDYAVKNNEVFSQIFEEQASLIKDANQYIEQRELAKLELVNQVINCDIVYPVRIPADIEKLSIDEVVFLGRSQQADWVGDYDFFDKEICDQRALLNKQLSSHVVLDLYIQQLINSNPNNRWPIGQQVQSAYQIHLNSSNDNLGVRKNVKEEAVMTVEPQDAEGKIVVTEIEKDLANTLASLSEDFRRKDEASFLRGMKR